MSAVIPIFDVEYEHPIPGEGAVNACDTKHAWARVPVEPSAAERAHSRRRLSCQSQSCRISRLISLCCCTAPLVLCSCTKARPPA